MGGPKPNREPSGDHIEPVEPRDPRFQPAASERERSRKAIAVARKGSLTVHVVVLTQTAMSRAAEAL